MYLDKMASGAWLCGMPQVQGMKEEDIADAEAVAKADELVNKITGGKALVLDALIQKLVKVNEILVKGVNKRAHMKYPFNKLNQVSNKIVNLYEKREAAAAASGDAAASGTAASGTAASGTAASGTAASGTAAATPALTEEQKAEAAAKKEAEDKQKKIDEEEKKKKEEEEKKIAEEKKKREEEEKKRLEEEKKLVDEYKKEVDDLVTKVGAELDTAIGK